MRFSRKLTAALIFSVFVSQFSYGISFEIGQGLNTLTGNTEFINLNYLGKIEAEIESLQFDVAVNGKYGKITTTPVSQHEGLLDIDYFLTANFSVFTMHDYYINNPQSIHVRHSHGAGLKYYFLRDDMLQLSLSAAPIYQREDNIYGITEIIRASIRPKISVNFNPYIELQSLLFYQPAFKDFNNYKIKWINSLNVKITRIFFLKTAFQYSYENMVLSTKKKSDYNFSESLVMKFSLFEEEKSKFMHK